MNAKDALKNKLNEALDVYGNGNNPEWLRMEAKGMVSTALTELEEIKKRAEEMRTDIIRCSLHEGCYDDGMVSINIPNTIDYIIKGEGK